LLDSVLNMSLFPLIIITKKTKNIISSFIQWIKKIKNFNIKYIKLFYCLVIIISIILLYLFWYQTFNINYILNLSNLNSNLESNQNTIINKICEENNLIDLENKKINLNLNL
jgi:hypothetical protein